MPYEEVVRKDYEIAELTANLGVPVDERLEGANFGAWRLTRRCS
jgi:hypothetical protein